MLSGRRDYWLLVDTIGASLNARLSMQVESLESEPSEMRPLVSPQGWLLAQSHCTIEVQGATDGVLTVEVFEGQGTGSKPIVTLRLTDPNYTTAHHSQVRLWLKVGLNHEIRMALTDLKSGRSMATHFPWPYPSDSDDIEPSRAESRRAYNADRSKSRTEEGDIISQE